MKNIGEYNPIRGIDAKDILKRGCTAFRSDQSRRSNEGSKSAFAMSPHGNEDEEFCVAAVA